MFLEERNSKSLGSLALASPCFGTIFVKTHTY